MSYIQAKRLVNSMKEKAKLKRVDNPIILILHNPLENASTGPKTVSVVRSWK
jgi:hypothetical protein